MEINWEERKFELFKAIIGGISACGYRSPYDDKDVEKALQATEHCINAYKKKYGNGSE